MTRAGPVLALPARVTSPVAPTALSPRAAVPPEEPQRPAAGRAFEAELGRRLSDAKGATVVRAARTPLTGTQAAAAIADAWAKSQGAAASPETLAVLTAQWAHETGRGESMLNFNFGGIKGASPEGATIEARTREGWGADERTIVDRFRAYESAEAGAADYLDLLARRYPDAIDAAKQGDAAGFVRALKARGYFTGNEGAYVASVSRMAQQAVAHGFDALGAAAGASARAHSVAPAPLAVMAPWLGDLAPSDGMTFVGAQAIADEVGRAALRIAASEGRADRDSWP